MGAAVRQEGQRLIRGAEPESGQAIVEYALIIAFIAVVCVATVTLFGQTIRDVLYTPVLTAF